MDDQEVFVNKLDKNIMSLMTARINHLNEDVSFSLD